MVLQVTCPTSCSADTSVEDCKCYCPDLDQWTKNSSTAKAKLIELDSAIWSSDDYTVVIEEQEINSIFKCSFLHLNSAEVPSR